MILSIEDYDRAEYEATLKKAGLESTMDPEWYKHGVKAGVSTGM